MGQPWESTFVKSDPKIQWNLQANVKHPKERGWIALSGVLEDVQKLWSTTLLLTSHGRILGKAILREVCPGLQLTMHAEDCTLSAAGTASMASSSKSIQQLSTIAFAKIGAEYHRPWYNTSIHMDVVNGMAVSCDTAVLALPVFLHVEKIPYPL